MHSHSVQEAALKLAMPSLGAALAAIACGTSGAPVAAMPEPQPARAPSSHQVSAPTDPRPESAEPMPMRPAQESVSEPPDSEAPVPEPGGDLGLQEEYARTEADLRSLSRSLDQRNREVAERYGRNDSPEALRILTPIRIRLEQAQRHLDQLTCRDRAVGNARQELERRQIPFDGFRVNQRGVDAYIAAKLVDREIAPEAAEELRFVLSKAGHGVMNPSSRGAHTINQRVAQALACFGLSGPPRSRMTLGDEPSPAPKPLAGSPFRFFRTCGDAVCQSYRGPSPGVPRCHDQREGAACSNPGATCDLRNNCNMHLICSDADPATRCPR